MGDEWPIAVVQDRYSGAYSGGAWIAIRGASYLENGAYRIIRCLEGGPSDEDLEAREFWNDPPSWVAVGETPDEAVRSLLAQSTQRKAESVVVLDTKLDEAARDLDEGRVYASGDVRAVLTTRFGGVASSST